MTTTGIYTITNLCNDKVYVGSAVNMDRRWARHLKSLRYGGHRNRHLQRAWNKYGENLFKFEVLLTCRKGLLIHNEQQVINKFIQNYGRKKLYNISLTAGSYLGVKHSPETKAKMSEAQKDRKYSPETKAKMSAAQKGSKHSPEARAKMSVAKLGRKRSPETRAKISKARKGYKPTNKARAKMSAAKLGRKGHKLSTEHKAKISAAKLGRKQSPEHIAKRLAVRFGTTGG